MTTLPDTYMPNRPAEHRVTVLDTPQDILWYHMDNGPLPDDDGNVRLRDGDDVLTVPLKGLYRVQLVENGIPAAGPGRLLTREQFGSQFSEFAEPYLEYGVKFLPRRNDIVIHGSLETAKDALDGLPALKGSGDYGIVRRLVHEPGDWEILLG
ncbi:MAG TPA: hypothetical protein VF867_00045 [Arthrobacter sp.]